MPLSKKIFIGIMLLVILVGGIIYYRWHKAAPELEASGTIEVTQVDVIAKVSGYTTGFVLDVGDHVTAGQTVATVVRQDLAAQVGRDAAALAAAERQLADLEAGLRSQEIAALVANLASARAVETRAADDYQRYLQLYNQGAIAAQQLVQAKSARDVATSAVAVAAQNLSLGQAGSRPEVIAAAQQEVARSRAVLATSQALLADTAIICPLNGLVLVKNYENGEFLNIGSALITVGDMQDCWVKIYIPSPYLGRLKVGQAANVKIDAYPERVFPGTIKEISENAEFTPRQSITPSERANLVFGVKVKIDNTEGILKPGMPADVVLL